MDIIKKNKSEVQSKELEEANDEPTVAYVPQSSLKSGNSDSEEPEEDPEEVLEEDPEEESEEDAEEEPEEDAEEEPEEDLEEETEEKLEEGSEVEPEEDPEEESIEASEEESAEEFASPSLSCHKSIETEQLIEDPNEDPSEVYVSEPSFENETEKADESCSNGKKRAVDKTAFESALLQNYQSQKKCRYEEIVKQELDVGSATTDLHIKSGVSEAVVGDESGSEKQENAGSSGKRRRSRWEPQPEQDVETGKGDGNNKKRKTRWADDDSQLRILGPLHLPDLGKDLGGSELDSEVQGMKARLSNINSKLQRSELHDDRPEVERSPSPQPEYNNLGLRINTREVRLRKKLIQERQCIILKLIKKNPTFETPPKYKPAKHCKKLYIPVKEYPEYNFVGLILGPRGNTQKRMEKETGTKILLRGKGSSMKTPEKSDPSDNEDLHVYIEAGNRKSLDTAVTMVEELLIPREEGMNDLKRAQLEELAKLRTYREENLCSVCKEQGHKHYACPQRQSTLKASCNTCGSVCHPTYSCPLTASPQVSIPLHNSSALDFGSTPNTKSKSNKEIYDANLYVGYLPQAVDDSRLRELFSPFGSITEAKVIKDHTTGLSKGYGFVKFDNPSDAVLAMMHMNGCQMDGNMLAVRVAGRPPATGSPAMRHLPMYPGPVAVVPSVPSWPVLPQAMLPEAQVSFPNSKGLCLTYSSVFLEHNNRFPEIGATGFPPPVVSGANESRTAFSSPALLAQFPGDPDYPGSEFQSYFATRTL